MNLNRMLKMPGGQSVIAGLDITFFGEMQKCGARNPFEHRCIGIYLLIYIFTVFVL